MQIIRASHTCADKDEIEQEEARNADKCQRICPVAVRNYEHNADEAAKQRFVVEEKGAFQIPLVKELCGAAVVIASEKGENPCENPCDKVNYYFEAARDKALGIYWLQPAFTQKNMHDAAVFKGSAESAENGFQKCEEDAV